MLVRCAGPKKVAYEFPTAMAPAIQAEYAKQCDKGKILYDINCSRCHTTKAKGKEIIPDFNALQLETYQIRITNETHENNLTETKVTAEELSLILTFLAYKKKNEVLK
ncbi:MAG: hypothetical protein H7321_02960 [Bacteroidia bacterium]|nr:hypothetical protein [Bacteroidia bacterium]